MPSSMEKETSDNRHSVPCHCLHDGVIGGYRCVLNEVGKHSDLVELKNADMDLLKHFPTGLMRDSFLNYSKNFGQWHLFAEFD